MSGRPPLPSTNGTKGSTEAARLIGCSPLTLRREVRAGILKPKPKKNVRGDYEFTKAHIAFLKKRRAPYRA